MWTALNCLICTLLQRMSSISAKVIPQINGLLGKLKIVLSPSFNMVTIWLFNRGEGNLLLKKPCNVGMKLGLFSKLRMQRALNARARKSQTFNTGDLVYFFRRGRGHGNRHESFWYGPARVVCVEKTSTEERNASPGSITWVAHGTNLLRCAPEQLQHATHTLKYVSSLYRDRQTPSEILRKAKNTRYHNLVPEVENLDDCDALQDEDPDVDTSLLNPRRIHTEPSVPGAPRYWAWGKQAPSSSPGCRRPKLSATRV